MKQILFITPFTPCNKDAGSNYTRQLLEKLSTNHQIDLIIFRYHNDETYKIPNKNLRLIYTKRNNVTFKILNVLTFPFIFPLFTVRFNWKTLIQIIKLIKHNSYDIIYFDFSQTFLYAKFIKHHNKILMSHDVILQRYTRAKSPFLTWIKYSEKWLLKGKHQHIFTFSNKDNQLLLHLYGINSKNVCFFIPNDAIIACPQHISNNIVLFAMWKRADNYQSLLWFIEHILPYISNKVIVIGGGLSNDIINKIKKFPNVQYLGFVNNPYPIISNSQLLLSPLFNGAGVKVKVIEALACGTPVIGTKIAFEGIDHIYSRFMIEANNASEYINLIKNLRFSLEERRSFKKNFIENYIKHSMLDYINDQI